MITEAGTHHQVEIIPEIAHERGGQGGGKKGDDCGYSFRQQSKDQGNADMAPLLEAIPGSEKDDGGQAVTTVLIGNQGCLL